jgi:hypothetical protein
MTDPKETTSDTTVERHSAGRPNDVERDPDRGSDVGGPAGGIETTLGDDLESGNSLGDDRPDSQARNPL